MASSPLLMKDDELWQYLWYISCRHMRVQQNVYVDMVLYHQLTLHRISTEATERSSMDNLFQANMLLLQNISHQSSVQFVHLSVDSSNCTIGIASDKCFAIVDTDQRPLEANATVGRQGAVFNAIICTIHGTAFCGLSRVIYMTVSFCILCNLFLINRHIIWHYIF
jgi:hypothetical protein